MKTKHKDLQSLNQFIDEKFGQNGTPKRDKFEAGYEAFKLGVLIQQAREYNRVNNSFKKLENIIIPFIEKAPRKRGFLIFRKLQFT